MKDFDALKWIRQVREANCERQKGMAPEQQIEDTRRRAAAFRASPWRKNRASKVP